MTQGAEPSGSRPDFVGADSRNADGGAEGRAGGERGPRRAQRPTPDGEAPVIDGHTHICGVGQGGTGCVISRKLLGSLAFRYLRWKLGLGAFGDPVDLDGRVRERLFSDLDASPSVDYVVLYGHDKVYGPDGKVREDLTQLHTPNDYVLRLAKEHPKILPGVSIHPDRPDALDELARCAAAGAVLVKWLPNSQGMDPAERRHRPFYEALARLGLPLVAHTGGEHTVAIGWPEYTDPARLELPLDCGVTVIAAHSGTRSGLVDPEFYPTFAALARKYPNCYGDTAAFGTPGRMRHIPRLLADPEVLAKTVHGSDYPIPVSAWWGIRQIPFGEIRRINAVPSIIERDVLIKRAAGMPEAHFRTLASLLPIRLTPGGRGASIPPVIDRSLLDILACPLCKTPVREEGDRLVCASCGRRYPVRDGIPVMLVEEAEPPASR